MKKPSAALHQLIQSLTKTEKRYFNLFAQRHVQTQKTHYLELYETIDRQPEYDEERLKETLGDHRLIKHLPAAKYYLYHLLLDSLHAFHEENSLEVKLRKKLHHAQLLLEKGLEEQSNKLVVRLRDEAQEHELFPLLVEVLHLQKQLQARQYYRDRTLEDLQQLHEEESEAHQQLQQLNEYWFLHGQMYLRHFRQSSIRSEEGQAALQELIAHPLLAGPEKANSKSGLMYFHQIWAIWHFGQGQAEEAWRHNRSFLHLMEEHPTLLRQHPRRYMATLNNYLIDSLNLGKYDELKAGLVKFRALPQDEAFRLVRNIEADIFRLSYILELNMHLNESSFTAGTQVLPQVEDGLVKWGDQIVPHNVITFRYLAAYLCFGAGQHKEALRWINQNLNEPADDVVEDIQAFSRILHLLIHYELENYDLLEYALRAVKRYLRTRKQLYEVEQEILQFLHMQERLPDQAAVKKALLQMRERLLPLREKPFERKAFSYFDFIAWIDSHVQEQAFESAVKPQKSAV